MLDSFPPARSATDNDIPAIVRLWEICGLTRPHNHAPTDIAFARKSPHAAVLVIESHREIVASALVGHDGHRGWVYYVAVDPSHQRRGLGGHIMAEAEKWLLDRGVWKLQLMVRQSNEAVRHFYETLGYADDEVSVFSKRLKPMPYIDPAAPL